MTHTIDHIDFTNHFLIAMPSMADATFSGTVIYICDHSERGSLGLVINRPTDLDLKTLLKRLGLTFQPELELKFGLESLLQVPVYFGGPVQTERGFVLHEPTDEQYLSSMLVPGGLAMTTSKDVLDAITEGKGPSKFLLTLGHAGWGAGQLEEEIASNGWLTVPAEASIVFDTPSEQRFSAALGLLGVSPAMLSAQTGHA